MSDLLIKGIPEELRNQFKALCAANGTNMREVLIKYMKEAVEKAALRG